MSSATYGTYPNVILSWVNTNLNYVVITYYGNAIVGTTSVDDQLTSGQQTGTTWKSGDLSFNATYTFTMTPYNIQGQAGPARTIEFDTTPSITASYATASSKSSAEVYWAGTYYYVRIYRKITSPFTGSYQEVSSNYIYSSPYYDDDLSGNTTYVYYVQPYDADGNAYQASTEFTVTTSSLCASDVSAIFYDSSSIQVSFTAPKNSFLSTYYYQLNATYSGTTTSVTGYSSPLQVTGLSTGTTYSLSLDSYLDGVLGATTPSITFSTTGYITIKDLSAVFYDSSSIQVNFTLSSPASTSYYYALTTTPSNGYATTASGSTTPIFIKDLSGNTTYTYSIGVYYDSSYISSTTGSTTVTTPVQSARDLSAIFYDSSAINVSFTLPRNSYTSSYYYLLNTTYNGVTTSVSGVNSPLLLTGLSGNTLYTYNLDVYLDDTYMTTTYNSVNIMTNIQAASNLSTTYYDSSSIKVSFTAPKNSYNSNYYYVLNASYNGYVTSVSGVNSPLWVLGLSSELTYSYYIDTYLDDAYGTSSTTYSLTTPTMHTYQFYYKFDDTASSTTLYNTGIGGNATVVGGNCYISTSTYKYGSGSLYNDGTSSSSYVTLPAVPTNTNGCYSVSFWYYFSAFSSTAELPLFSFCNAATPTTTRLKMSYYYNTSNTSVNSIRLYNNNFGGNINVSLTTGSWNHIVWVFKGDGNTYPNRLYVNTVLKYSGGNLSSLVKQSFDTATIFASYNGSSYDVGAPGYIDNFVFYDGEFSYEDVVKFYYNNQ